MCERWMSRPIVGEEEGKAMRIESTLSQDLPTTPTALKTTLPRKDIHNPVGRRFQDEHVNRLMSVNIEYERVREKRRREGKKVKGR